MLVRAFSWIVLALMGLVVATVGVGSHRSWGYAGVALGILATALVAVFAKTWQGWAGFIAYAVTWGAMTMLYSSEGPGGSVLVAGDLRGYVWLYGGSTAVAIVAAIPRSVWAGRDVTP